MSFLIGLVVGGVAVAVAAMVWPGRFARLGDWLRDRVTR